MFAVTRILVAVPVEVFTATEFGLLHQVQTHRVGFAKPPAPLPNSTVMLLELFAVTTSASCPR